MGLCLTSNKDKLNLPYSAFNRMRFLILAYVQNEDFETVNNNSYLYHFISAYSDDIYTFKYFIEHSDNEGSWNKEEIDTLIAEFDEHYSKIIEHNKKYNNFHEEYDDKMLFQPLINLLKESKGKIRFM